MKLNLSEVGEGDEEQELTEEIGEGGETASRRIGALILVGLKLSAVREEDLRRKELCREGDGVEGLRSVDAQAAYGWMG